VLKGEGSFGSVRFLTTRGAGKPASDRSDGSNQSSDGLQSAPGSFVPRNENLASFRSSDGSDDGLESSPLADHPSDEFLAPGQRSIKPIEVLGKGAFATVFLVVDEYSQETFALKRIAKEKQNSEEVLNEMELTRKCVHPHVIGVVEMTESAEFYDVLMPYIRGLSWGICFTLLKALIKAW